MANNNICSLLGLANRAGKLVSGNDTTISEMKKNRIKLVIIATDASENTKKLFIDKSNFRNIQFKLFLTKLEIGRSLGKSPRSVVGIRDSGFVKKIIELIEIKIQ